MSQGVRKASAARNRGRGLRWLFPEQHQYCSSLPRGPSWGACASSRSVLGALAPRALVTRGTSGLPAGGFTVMEDAGPSPGAWRVPLPGDDRIPSSAKSLHPALVAGSGLVGHPRAVGTQEPWPWSGPRGLAQPCRRGGALSSDGRRSRQRARAPHASQAAQGGPGRVRP